MLVGPEVEKKELPATFQLKIGNLEAVFSLVQAGYKEFSNSKGWVFCSKDGTIKNSENRDNFKGTKSLI